MITCAVIGSVVQAVHQEKSVGFADSRAVVMSASNGAVALWNRQTR
jgi:hypothetical protein